MALKLAGQVFEQLRASGETLEASMREAERTLHIARDAARTPPESAGPVPRFAWEVLSQVATYHRVTVDAMQLRGGAAKVAAARDEAASILVRLSLTPTQVGRLLRRDRYAANAAVRRFEERLKAEPVLQARIDHVVAAFRAAQAGAGDSPPRRPPARAANLPAARATSEGGAS